MPDDGYYYVILKGEVAGRFKSLNKAVARYNELKETLDLKPIEVPELPAEELWQRDMENMSNKRLIWTEEDFVRVERRTRGKKGTRSAG